MDVLEHRASNSRRTKPYATKRCNTLWDMGHGVDVISRIRSDIAYSMAACSTWGVPPQARRISMDPNREPSQLWNPVPSSSLNPYQGTVGSTSCKSI
jgi:hypothetical protein